MDIEFVRSRLKEGEIFKNRQALCERLEVPYTNQTNPKKSQDKEWRQYFEFEKVKGTHNIKITKIHDIEKIDFTVKGSIMPQFLNPAVLLYLSQKTDKYFTLTELASILNFCSLEVINFYKSNDIYHELENRFAPADKNSDKKKFNSFANFISYTQNSYDSRLKSSIKRLNEMGLIRTKQVHLIINKENFNSKITSLIVEGKYDYLKANIAPQLYARIENEIINTDIRKDDFLIYYHLNTIGITDDEVREATPEEVEFINEITSTVLAKYNYSTEQEFYSKTGWHPEIRRNFQFERNTLYESKNIKNYKAYKLEWIDKRRISTIQEEPATLLENINRIFYNSIKRNKLTEYRKERIKKNQKSKYPEMTQISYMRKEEKKKLLLDEFLKTFIRQ